MNEEKRWIDRLRRSDESALGELMDRYGNEVLRTAALLLKDSHLAEDVSQETFLLAYRRIGQLRGEGSLKGWLLQITVNLCRSRMRRSAWKRLLIGSPIEDGEIRQVRGETKDIVNTPGSRDWIERLELREAVGKLPLPYRETIVLYYFHDMPIRDMAVILGEKENTVKSKLLRARKLLRLQLEEGGWRDEGIAGEGIGEQASR